MGRTLRWGILTALAIACAPWLHGCTGRPPSGQTKTASLTDNAAERDCLVRAMYFESNRSSRDGLMAVGTVVMNRVASPRFPNTICGVVAQDRQFAPGVLTRPLDPRQVKLAERSADSVLAGERYKPIGGAMWFHTAGLVIPYRVQYTAEAGGNAFYLKTGRRWREEQSGAPAVATASAPQPVQQASLAPDVRPENFLQQLYRNITVASASSRPSKTCDVVAAGFGSRSLACEDEAAGR